MGAVNRAGNRVRLRRDGFLLRFLLRVEHRFGDDLRLTLQSFLANRFLRFRQRVRNGFGLLRKRLRHQSRLETLRFLLTVDKFAHCFGQQGGLRFGNHVGNHFGLFRGIHTERRRPAEHRHGRSFCRRFQNRLFLRVKQFLLRFQQFRLRFTLRLRHGFRLLFQQFVGLNPRLRHVRVFNNDLRHGRTAARTAVFLNRRKQSRQCFIGVFLRFGQSFGNNAALHLRRALLRF